MKILKILLPLLIVQAAQSKVMFYGVECEGITKEGHSYRVTAEYAIEEELMNCGDPCEVNLEGQNVIMSLDVYDMKANKSLHVDQTYFDKILIGITDDQTTYDFNVKGQEAKAFFSVVPAYADAPGSVYDNFAFKIGKAQGKFEYGSCKFSGPAEDF